MAFEFSPQQKEFFDFLRFGEGNGILISVAGSGKTTTICKGIENIRGRVFLGAFNKAAAGELKTKTLEFSTYRDGIYISTMHAAGFSAFNRGRKTTVEEKKTKTICEELIRDAFSIDKDVKAYLGQTGAISRIVSFAKQYLFGVGGRGFLSDDWYELGDKYGVFDDIPESVSSEKLIELSRECLKLSNELCNSETPIIDFDDMLYAPILLNSRMFKNDWVFIDECQDTNPARLELASRMLSPSGRFIAVGDPRQAIYGFAGADSTSVDIIRKRFNCKVLNLTVSYRCPKAVVAYARNWVEHISSHPTAPEGEVSMVVHTDEAPWYMALHSTDAVICRNNAPLINVAYALIRNGKACKVEGREIGKGLIAIVTRWKIRGLSQFESKLEHFREQEVTKAQAKEKHNKVDEINDKCDTIKLFIERCREKGLMTVADLIQEIEALFADNVSGVTTLLTGHKAKGREWGRVYWLEVPASNREMRDWEREQEDNLKYVIATRAKQCLFRVPSHLVVKPKEKKPEPNAKKVNGASK